MTRTVAIEEVADINPSVPARIRTLPGETPVPFLAMASVSENGKASYTEPRALQGVVKGYTHFERGDVLLAKITPCFENGKAALLEDLPAEFGFGSTEFHVLRPNERVDPRYLFYAVWNPRFRRALSEIMTGSAGQKRVPADTVRAYRIPLPSLDAQHAIAKTLEKADSIRRKRQESILLLDDLLTSTFLGMFGEKPQKLRGWASKPLSELIDETQYGTSQRANSSERGIPVLRMNNLTRTGDWDLSDLKWSDVPEADRAKYTVRRGDILFNRTNSPELVGKTAVWDREEPYAFAGYLIRIRVQTDRLLPEYLSGFLNSARGKQLLLARAMPSINMSNISASNLMRLKVPVPDLETQGRFRDVVLRVAKTRQAQLATLPDGDRLYDSLVHDAFGTG